jgi:hypothetical protein
MLHMVQNIVHFKQQNMKPDQIKRIKWYTIRLTVEEYQQLEALAAKTICPSLSDYGRRVLLQKPVNVLRRNQSLDDFVTDMLLLRRELNQIGNNFNQAVHRLNTLQHTADIHHWLLLNEQDKNRLFQLIDRISQQITQAHRKWSHV